MKKTILFFLFLIPLVVNSYVGSDLLSGYKSLDTSFDYKSSYDSSLDNLGKDFGDLTEKTSGSEEDEASFMDEMMDFLGLKSIQQKKIDTKKAALKALKEANSSNPTITGDLKILSAQMDLEFEQNRLGFETQRQNLAAQMKNIGVSIRETQALVMQVQMMKTLIETDIKSLSSKLLNVEITSIWDIADLLDNAADFLLNFDRISYWLPGTAWGSSAILRRMISLNESLFTVKSEAELQHKVQRFIKDFETVMGNMSPRKRKELGMVLRAVHDQHALKCYTLQYNELLKDIEYIKLLLKGMRQMVVRNVDVPAQIGKLTETLALLTQWASDIRNKQKSLVSRIAENEIYLEPEGLPLEEVLITPSGQPLWIYVSGDTEKGNLKFRPFPRSELRPYDYVVDTIMQKYSTVQDEKTANNFFLLPFASRESKAIPITYRVITQYKVGYDGFYAYFYVDESCIRTIKSFVYVMDSN